MAMKCYTGPNCRLHSTMGARQARQELEAALTELDKITSGEPVSTEDYLASKTRYDKALLGLDATAKGQDELKTHIHKETDPLIRASLIVRLRDGEEAMRAQEIENQPQQDPAFALKGSYAWVENTYDNVDEEGRRVGPKYKPGVKIEDTARSLRKDIRSAVEDGYLPAGPTYIVHTQPGAMGPILNVAVQGATGYDAYNDEQKKELTRRLHNLSNSYNISAPSVAENRAAGAYTVNVAVETAQQAEARRALTKERRQFIAEAAQKSFVKFAVDHDIHFAPGPHGVYHAKVGTEAGKFYAFLNARPGQPQTVRVYDLSDAKEPAAGWDTVLKQSNLANMWDTTFRSPLAEYKKD